MVEEGIDTAKSSGKLLVSVLAAVAEIERENILIQTQAGREQKATEGRWNGGFAPYGYRLENGELYIDEEEAKIIRTIYDLYTNQALGLAGVAKYLNTHGVVKKVRQNGTLARFSSAFVKGVLDNPVYMGKISYGRRRTEKKDNGRRNDFHVVKQDEFEIYDGIHEAIVSEELWNKTHEKRVRTGVKSEKLYNKGRVHLLTGILKCPVCGGPLYGNVNRKKKPDGTLYKEHFYYACKHRLDIDGHKCEYRKQWREEEVNKEVLDIIVKVLDDDMLKVKMKDWFGIGDDDEQVRVEIEKLNLSVTDIRKRIRKLEGRQDSLPVDELYDEKFENLQKRIDGFYEDIKHLNNEITQLEQKLDAEHKEVLKQHEATAEEYVEAYKALLPLGVSEAQDRDLIRSIVEKIEIFEQRQEDGRLVKSIEFKVPVEYNGEVGDKIYWDKEKQVETVCLLVRGKPDPETSIDIYK